MIERQFFNMADTGTMVDTGPHFSGRVAQWRWENTSGDTGGTLEVGIYPRTGDTGAGWLIVNRGLEPQARAAFPTTDTGVATYGAGDRLRVKKTGATGAGRFWAWIEN
jgi:hypothetical protein